jgi:GNAT superfamily N-acetyltransferase
MMRLDAPTNGESVRERSTRKIRSGRKTKSYQMSETRIVQASPAIAWCLTAIAFSAKAYWGYPASWLNGWRQALTITPSYIRDHPTFTAVHRQRMVGFYSIENSSATAVLEHLWILPLAMKKGVGSQLFTHAELYSIQSGCREMMIESDPHAEGFYQRKGAQTIDYHESSIGGISRRLPVMRKVFQLYV